MTPTERALYNIRGTAKALPKSVGSYHRTILVEAANTLEAELAKLAVLRNLLAELASPKGT